MKSTLILLLLISIAWAMNSCSSFVECDSIEKRHAFLLMDVSDKELFHQIEEDVQHNFPQFMERTGLGQISPCESFTFSFAHFSAFETLDISSKTISIQRKGLSHEEERRLSSPRPLVKLLKHKMNEFGALTDQKEVISNTNIANVLLKSITQSSLDSDNYYILFTDGVENSKQLNLYRGIPEEEEIENLLPKLIEPSVLDRYLMLRAQGLQSKIIMVLKSEPAARVERREIKAFWVKVFDELKLQYQFVDNLSNQVDL